MRAQTKTDLFRVYDYFDNLEQRGGDRGALSRTSKATGEQTSYCCERAVSGWTSCHLLSATSHQGGKLL